jgi:hypothetical protein
MDRKVRHLLNSILVLMLLLGSGTPLFAQKAPNNGGPPVVNAGIGATICENQALSITDASASNYISITWSSDGDGTWSPTPPITINPTYFPGTADKANAGFITLMLTANPGNPTSQTTDTKKLTIQDPPDAEAGSNASICETGTRTISDASATNYNSVTWTTGGDGTFSDVATLTPTYTPGTTDKTNPSVILTLHATAKSPCTIEDTDFMTLTILDEFTPGAIETNGETICYEDDPAEIGNKTDASGGDGNIHYQWQSKKYSSKSPVDFVDIGGATEASYNPPTGLTESTVYRRTAYDETCNKTPEPSTGEWIVTVKEIPTATAGGPARVCEGDSYTLQSGEASASNGDVLWTHNGGGTLTDETTLTPTYTKSDGGITGGFTDLLQWLTQATVGGAAVTIEDFSSLPPGPLSSPHSFTSDPFSYTAEAPSGLFVRSNFGRDLTTGNTDEIVTITFSSEVTCVGVNLYPADNSGNFTPGPLMIDFHSRDLTLQVSTFATGPENFIGFTSTSPITYLEITSLFPGTKPVLNNLIFSNANLKPDATVALTLTVSNSPCDPAEDTFTITFDEFTAGAIATTGETICYEDDPAEIGSDTDASGGDGNINYAWYSSTNDFTDSTLISGATLERCTPPAGLTETTSYRRYAHDATCNTDFEVSTGTWTVTVYDEFHTGYINASYPATGQQTSYQANDDGALQLGKKFPNPRFTNNNNGTITDNMTGLIWLKKGNVATEEIWSDALLLVQELNTLGTMRSQPCGDISNGGAHQTDWRLPNRNEMESLMNLEEGNQFNWLASQGFELNGNARYWTSTTLGKNPDDAWHAQFSEGRIRHWSKEFNSAVWAVRGDNANKPDELWQTGQTTSYGTGDDGQYTIGTSSPEPRFIDNNDGTVKDLLTNLVWLKDANITNTATTWADAYNWISELNTSGTMNGTSCGDESNGGSHQTDWRLPNRKEMISLLSMANCDPALPDGHPIENATTLWYWTSSTYKLNTNNAWQISIGTGSISHGSKANTSNVWPVRTASTVGETICYNTVPAVIIGKADDAGGGDGNITYSWRSSADNYASAISGANGATYTPTQTLTTTTGYRRYANDESCNLTPVQSIGTWTVTVNDDFTTGAIETNGETICYEDDPAEIGSDTDASGGDEDITYAWYKSTDDFTDSTLIFGETLASYNPPTGLTETTSYRRYAHDATCNTDFEVSTGTWTVTVYNEFTPGATKGYQTIVSYPFTSDLNYSLLSSDVSEAILDFSKLYESYIADDGYGNVLQTYQDGSSFDAATALANDAYFSLTLNAVSSLNLDSLLFEVGKGGSSDPRGFFIRSSIDNFANDLISETLPAGSQPPPELHELALNASFEGLTTVTFRFYIFSPEDYYSIDWRNLKIVYVVQGETICYEGDPAEIGSDTDASGGDEDITYQWQSSTNAGFTGIPTDIANDAATYDPPSGLTVDTWYRRQAKDETCKTVWETSAGVWKVSIETTKPDAKAKAITIYLDDNGGATIVASDINDGSTDNCSIETYEVSKTDFTCDDLGDNDVTLTVTDYAGNSEEATSVVTVLDIIDPVAKAKNITVTLDPNGVASITGESIDDGSGDNCGFNLSASITSFTCDDLGPNYVTLTVTDDSNNSDTEDCIVTVEEGTDLLAPWQKADTYYTAYGTSGYSPCTANGTFRLTATGKSTTTNDVMHFVYQEIGNTATIIARLDDIDNGGYAGVMIRESLSPSAKTILFKTLLFNPNVYVGYRTTAGQAMRNLSQVVQLIRWMKIQRNGNIFKVFTSYNGTTWMQRYSGTITMGPTAYAGIFTESVRTDRRSVAWFDNVSLWSSLKSGDEFAEAEIINLESEDSDVQVYPNPANSEITIVYPFSGTNSKAIFTNTAGKVVMIQQLNSNTSKIDVSNLAPGVYIVTLLNNESVVTKRLVIN